MQFRSTVSRPAPAGPPEAFNTYRVRTPILHLRDVPCSAAHCGAYHNGWDTIVDYSTALGQAQAQFIATQSGRRYVAGHYATGAPDSFTPGPGPGSVVVFRFEPGQTCFNRHQVNDGPMDLIVARGDWRRSEVIRRHTRPIDWVEDCAEAVDRFNQRRKRG